MERPSENWVWVAVAGAFVAMHLLGRGGHGGHKREFLTIPLPGFEWLTPKGFAIGLARSFLYGALLGLVYVPIHNALECRFGG